MEESGDILPDYEELLKKHKLERKDLQSKVQSLKKSVPKGDKKKKKEITDEIEKLEKELDDRHTQELSQFKTITHDDDITSNTIPSAENSLDISNNAPQDSSVSEQDFATDLMTESALVTEAAPVEVRVSRAQKRRNKKDLEAKEREKRISEQAERNKDGPRVIEMNTIKQTLKESNLKIHNIPANGNCLYLAVNHQLQIAGQLTYSVNDLRKKTAEFMRLNKEDFMPFMYNELDESEIIGEDTFENYCNDVANTKLWGGQLELRALSNILTCPIKVIQATGPPTLQGENFNGPELILTYHRHLYRLGEHYNSTSPIGEEEDES